MTLPTSTQVDQPPIAMQSSVVEPLAPVPEVEFTDTPSTETEAAAAVEAEVAAAVAATAAALAPILAASPTTLQCLLGGIDLAADAQNGS